MSGKALKQSTVEALKRKTAKTRSSAAASTLRPFNALTVDIANRQRTRKINTRLLKQLVSTLFAELKIETAELGINLVGPKEMAQVNWNYLQHEGSTDVITFNHLHSSFVIHNSNLHLHGELLVCVDDAVKQAREFRTTWQSEVVRYVVHGVLHLLGHDDLKPDLRRKMKREENRLVQRLEKSFTFTEL